MAKKNKSRELDTANKKLAVQHKEKEKRAKELIIANKELAFQNKEKGKRAAELIIANKELAYQNKEKEKKASKLIIANNELAYQNKEKGKRAQELIVANKELAYQNKEKEKRAAELVIANKELAFQNKEKEKKAAKLIIANKELAFQNKEKGKRAAELIIANKKLAVQNDEKEKRLTELLVANYARSLIEATLDPLVTIDKNGMITDVNQAMVKATAKSRKKLIGTDFTIYFVERKKARKIYKEVFKKGLIMNYPLTIVDGVLTDVLINGSVYKSDSGKVMGAVMVARDITELKRIETELTEARIFAELATSIAEEAKFKAESVTVIAEKATEIAVDAVKAKQQFLSNMSHEIRTPMNAIIGFTKVVLKTELTAKQKEYLTAIKLSGDSLIVLINDILDLAKVDAGKMTFEKTPFKMALSISAMLHLFEPKIQEKNLLLVKEYDNKIPEVLVGDPVRLHQIILNLVSNAVKFTSNGKITVSVRLVSEDARNVVVEFAVTDTGIGIPHEKIGKIFENFQQASSGTSRLYGGTGLGLAIVKQLVEPQGGKILVKSKPDEGSVFSFILTFQKTKLKPEAEMELMELDSKIKNIKVLVVEDIDLNQLLMKTLLDDFGFQREIAANGKIAIEMMEAKSFDIVLMDLQMPEMNGFEATEYIRNKMKSKIPIIALTADVTTVDLAKCTAVGMNDYIAKPVDERLLYNKIVGLVLKPALANSIKEKDAIENSISKFTDLSYLNQRTKSDPVLMSEMISAYLKQTPPLIGSIKNSLRDKDWEMLKASTHKIIPSFSIMGMSKDFENLARRVYEYASTQTQESEIQEMILQLENACTQACKELEEELNKMKGSK